MMSNVELVCQPGDAPAAAVLPCRQARRPCFEIDCAARMLGRRANRRCRSTVGTRISRTTGRKPIRGHGEAAVIGRSSARDVARLAGVSTATVSRALNLPASVEPATLQRVHAAIDKLRYVPHGAARALRSRRSDMLGAVVPSFDYALYARTTSALQREADARGYAVVLATHHYDLATEVRVTQQMIQHGVDAFAFVGLDHDRALYSLLERHGRPYVLTWGVDPSRLHPSIGFDNRAATYAMTRHLLDIRHHM
jgi:LacI family transcriptional regulator